MRTLEVITRLLARTDGWLQFSQLVERSRGVILLYHAIDDPDGYGDRPPVTLEIFKRQLSLLCVRYEFCTLTELFADRAEPGRKRAVLTFDDGHRSFADLAWPLLRERGIPATIFICPGLLGRRDLLTAAEVRSLGLDSRIEIGNHTRTHADLSGPLSRADLEREVVGGWEGLESLLGKPVSSFAYPWGRWGGAAVELIRRTHAFAVTTAGGVVWAEADRALLPRVVVAGDPLAEFAFAVTDMRQMLRQRLRR